MSLDAVILAGGLATRLGLEASQTPKALVDVNGSPFLAHQLKLLRDAGVARAILCIAHLGAQIRDFAGDGSGFGIRLDYSEDGDAPLGTAGAIRNALPLLPPEFFVLYGDSYLPCDYGAVCTAFYNSGQPALMTVYRNDSRWDASNVEMSGGRIVAYDKNLGTDRMRYIDYGLGVFRRGVFSALPPGPRDLAGLYRDLLAAGELAAFEAHERFYEIGSPEGLRELREHLR